MSVSRHAAKSVVTFSTTTNVILLVNILRLVQEQDQAATADFIETRRDGLNERPRFEMLIRIVGGAIPMAKCP